MADTEGGGGGGGGGGEGVEIIFTINFTIYGVVESIYGEN